MKNAEELIDAIIMEDGQNTLFGVYEKETGHDPVSENGGHTEEFETWFVENVIRAWEAGARNIPSALGKIAGKLDRGL